MRHGIVEWDRVACPRASRFRFELALLTNRTDCHVCLAGQPFVCESYDLLGGSACPEDEVHWHPRGPTLLSAIVKENIRRYQIASHRLATG